MLHNGATKNMALYGRSFRHFFARETFLGGKFPRGVPAIARKAEKNAKKGETAKSAISVTLLLKWDETPAKPP